MIKKSGTKWVLYTKDGRRRLGTFRTKKDALDRERQIQIHKHKRKNRK